MKLIAVHVFTILLPLLINCDGIPNRNRVLDTLSAVLEKVRPAKTDADGGKLLSLIKSRSKRSNGCGTQCKEYAIERALHGNLTLRNNHNRTTDWVTDLICECCNNQRYGLMDGCFWKNDMCFNISIPVLKGCDCTQ